MGDFSKEMQSLISTLESVISPEISSKFIATFVLVLFVFLIRAFLRRQIQKWKFPTLDMRRKWWIIVRNGAFGALTLGLLLIWGSEIQNFAVSLVALAVAFTIGTKEIISCILGGILKASSKTFRVGDRIQVAGYKGEVVDHDFLTTSLLPSAPRGSEAFLSGQVLTLPNSIFLSEPVSRIDGFFRYHFHTVRIWLPLDTPNMMELKGFAEKAAKKVCEPYQEEASAHIRNYRERLGGEELSAEPKIAIKTNDHEGIQIVIRIPVPKDMSSRKEQELLEDFYLQKEKSA